MAGKSFIEALEEKYADCDMATSASMFVLKNMDVAGSKGSVRVPREMSLHRLGVMCAGDVTKIREICCQVTGVDVTNNMLTDWNEIFTILTCMPRVRFVNLSENLLTEPLAPPADLSFPNIQHLALNSTSIPMTSVDGLLKVMPNVSELHLCLNGYMRITLEGTYPTVDTLFLNANKLEDFREVLKLSDVFPNLRQLLLLNNPFTCLPDVESIRPTFPCLQCLNITETGLNSWAELEKLRHFPALTDIRMKKLPLFEGMDELLRRQFVISYLPALVKLNLSKVGDEERVTAERRFVRYFAEQEEKPERFSDLEAKYGSLAPLVDIDFSPQTTCSVEIHFGGKVTKRVVDVRQTVTEFKKVLAKEVAKMAPSKFKLFHESSDEWMGCNNLFASGKLYLHTLHVGDDHRFYIRPNYEHLQKQ